MLNPILCATRNTCVSTAIVGLANAQFKITLAVFLPIPGNFINSSNSSGIIELYLLIKISQSAMIFFAFELYKPMVFIYGFKLASPNKNIL